MNVRIRTAGTESSINKTETKWHSTGDQEPSQLSN